MVAGKMAPAAGALRSALKEAAGKLVAQLYDRNSRRQFVPLEAFQADSLPPERFRVEMQTAAAASGGLMQATNTRVWGLLRWGPTWGGRGVDSIRCSATANPPASDPASDSVHLCLAAKLMQALGTS